jgi:hypothetical protein
MKEELFVELGALLSGVSSPTGIYAHMDLPLQGELDLPPAIAAVFMHGEFRVISSAAQYGMDIRGGQYDVRPMRTISFASSPLKRGWASDEAGDACGEARGAGLVAETWPVSHDVAATHIEYGDAVLDVGVVGVAAIRVRARV